MSVHGTPLNDLGSKLGKNVSPPNPVNTPYKKDLNNMRTWTVYNRKFRLRWRDCLLPDCKVVPAKVKRSCRTHQQTPATVETHISRQLTLTHALGQRVRNSNYPDMYYQYTNPAESLSQGSNIESTAGVRSTCQAYNQVAGLLVRCVNRAQGIKSAIG